MIEPDQAVLPSNVQIAWDSTSMSTFKTCPRKYQLSIIEGWRSQKPIPSLSFGIALHSLLELWDKSTANGEDKDQAFRAVIKATLAYEKLSLPDGKFADPEWLTMSTDRSRLTLLRSVVWYILDHWDDNLTTLNLPDGRPAVELSFRVILPVETDEGESYFYCGHIDKLVEMAGNKHVLDRKHTTYPLNKQYFDKYTPDNQMSGYIMGASTLVGEMVHGAIIDAAQVGVTFTRFMRGLAERSDDMIQGWLKDLYIYIKQAEGYARNNHWPMNDTSCHHYGGCQFRGICHLPPANRAELLRAHFKIEKWNPLASRD